MVNVCVDLVTEAEVYVDKRDIMVFIIIAALVGFAHYVGACEIKRVYTSDGKMQVCQVCKDVVICY